MHLRTSLRNYLAITAVLVLMTACSHSGMEIAAPETLPTLVSLATLPATAVDTLTPTPTATMLPPTNTAVATNPLAATMESSATPATSATPLPLPSATPTPMTIDRACPNPPPQRPEYERNNLGAQPWPTPIAPFAEIAPHFSFIKPVPGGGRTLINKTYPYGSDGGDRYLLHNGIDISGEFDMPVFAVADGTVIVAQADERERYGWRCDWYGNLVILELEQTWLGENIFVLYGHVLDIVVEEGQSVQQGEPLAAVGIGGAAIAPHLHLEVRVGRNTFDATQNPMLWIDPGPTRGVVVGRLLDPDGRPWQGVTVTLIGNDEDELQFINSYTYMGDARNLINPDPFWAENFLFADVPPGNYQLFAEVQGVEYRSALTVTGGDISAAEIITAAYKTPTPTAAVTASATPEATGTPDPTAEP